MTPTNSIENAPEEDKKVNKTRLFQRLAGPLLILAGIAVSATLTGCSTTPARATEVAPEPGRAEGTSPLDSTSAYDPEIGIQVVRKGGVVSPKCARVTISNVTEPCASLSEAECRLAAEKKMKLRAVDRGGNLLFISTEGMKDGEYTLGGQVWHCPLNDLDLTALPGGKGH